MDAITKFRTDLEGWLIKHGFEKLGFVWHNEYAYGFESHRIFLSTMAYPKVDEWLDEFFVDHGCHYTDIAAPVKYFLHELGHHETISQFSTEDLGEYMFLKMVSGDMELSDKEYAYNYWSIPDEMAANQWAIDFINEHIDAVCDLIDVYYNDWNAIVYNYDLDELVGQPL